MGIKTQLLLYLVVVALVDFDLMFSRLNGVEGLWIPLINMYIEPVRSFHELISSINKGYAERRFKELLEATGPVIPRDLNEFFVGPSTSNRVQFTFGHVTLICNCDQATVKFANYFINEEYRQERPMLIKHSLTIEAPPGADTDEITLQHEYELLRQVQSDHIVKAVAFGTFGHGDRKRLAIVTQEQLRSLANISGKLTEDQLCCILRDSLVGLNELHKQNISVGKIGTENIKIDHVKGCAYLTNLTHAKKVGEDYRLDPGAIPVKHSAPNLGDNYKKIERIMLFLALLQAGGGLLWISETDINKILNMIEEYNGWILDKRYLDIEYSFQDGEEICDYSLPNKCRITYFHILKTDGVDPLSGSYNIHYIELTFDSRIDEQRLSLNDLVFVR